MTKPTILLMALWLTLTTTWAQTDATSSIVNPNFDFEIETGDLVWVIGSEGFVSKLISANVYGL